jgi:hypothetical protein
MVYQKQAVHHGGHGVPETSCASWWTWCTRNKLCSCIIIFFVCNAVDGQLLSTATFEISMNEIPLCSNLETARIPQPPELFKIVEKHMQFAALNLCFVQIMSIFFHEVLFTYFFLV